MKMWMFNCKDVSHLVSQSMDMELSFTKRMGIRFHLLMCKYCARFEQQLTRIRELIPSKEKDQVPSLKMDDKAKKKLKKLLHKDNLKR